MKAKLTNGGLKTYNILILYGLEELSKMTKALISVTMMMIVDLDGAHLDFEEINRRLQPVREEKNMTIHMQRMDIFDAMHRI